ncbi:hypothetical protein TNCV_3368021 [Trichonephila clavipes]|nr:hypothetical protein TNCV_3368021 [Trichonephila clavipes]
MSRSGGQSEVKSPVFKSPTKLGTPLSTHYNRDEKAESTLPLPSIEPRTCDAEARNATTRPLGYTTS